MAQIVGMNEYNIYYTEGPFVMVYFNGWNIECELKGYHCPVLCDPSIYDLLKSKGIYEGKTENKDKIANAVDWLNDRVREGVITLKNNIWVF